MSEDNIPNTENLDNVHTETIKQLTESYFQVAITKSDLTRMDGEIEGEKRTIFDLFVQEKTLHPENQTFSEQDLSDYVTTYQLKIEAERAGDLENAYLYGQRIQEYDNLLNEIITYPESTINTTVLDEIKNQIEGKVSKNEESSLMSFRTNELEGKLSKLSSSVNKSAKKAQKQMGSIAEHIYPVELIESWTKKLHYYNEQLDEFIGDINKVDVNIPMEWLRKIVKQFVKRINFGIALLRYYIVKALWGMLSGLRKQVEFIAPIIMSDGIEVSEEGVKVLPPGHWIFTGQIWKVVGAIISWIKAVIKWFLHPYLLLIQFAIDFMTYTPPLIEEVASLLVKVVAVPPIILSKVLQIAEKHIKEGKTIVSTECGTIKMQPINFQELMSSNPPEKPVYAEFSDMADEYKELKTTKQKQVDEVKAIWDKFVASTKEIKVPEDVYISAIAKENRVYKGTLYYMKVPEVMNVVDGYKIAWRIFGSKKLLDFTAPTGKPAPSDKAPLVGQFSELRNDVRKALKVSQVSSLLEGSFGKEVYQGLYNYLLALTKKDTTKNGIEYYYFLKDLAKKSSEYDVAVNTLLTDMKKGIVQIWTTNENLRKMEVRSWRK